jgi:hypothetical protein
MSAFKDAIKKDVKSVFMNGEEFAENHTINGQIVTCIIDKDINTEAQSAKGNITLEGVFVNTVTIYVSSDDIETRPVEGERLNVDGSFHVVRNVSDENGILAIVAEEFNQ